MWGRTLASALCTLLLSAAAAHAQTPAAVYVSAPDVRITAGDSVQLTAVARDAAGNVMNAAFQWASTNTSVAEVSSSGMVQARGLGLVDVNAAAGSRVGTIRLQVLPKRVEVTPADISLNFGGEQQFSAVAYDSQDQPIPNVNFTWRVLVAGGGFDSATVRISADGVLSATTLGYYVVRAAVVYPSTPNSFQREFDGSTPMRIVPADYDLAPVLSSAARYPSFRMIGKRGHISVNDSGQLAFSALLDGVTMGLLTWRDSALSVIAAAGSAGLVPGTLFFDFDNASIDSRGNVLATAGMSGAGNNIFLANADGTRVVVPDRAEADLVLDVANPVTTRFSLSENGDFVYRANFRYDDSTVNYNGLIRYNAGRLYLEVSSKDPLPGLTGTPSFDDFGIDGKGAIYFTAFAGSGRAIYRKEFFKDPVKVIGFGDPLAGSTVTALLPIAVGAEDLVVGGGLASGSPFLARYFAAAPATPPTVLITNNVNQTYAVNGKGGVVWLGDAGQGYGLYLWPKDAPPRLILRQLAPSPTGEPVASFFSAAVDASGTVYASISGVETPWMLIRAAPSPAVLAVNGDRVDVEASIDLSTNIIPGDRIGPMHVLAGGYQPSIFQADKRGLIPSIVVGDRLPGGQTYMGNFSSRKSSSGDLYVYTDNAVFRLSSTSQSLVASFPYTAPDGTRLFTPFSLAVNDRNQLLMFHNTDRSHQRLTLFDGKDLRTIAYFGGGAAFPSASPGGGTFSGLNDMAINESGQAMMIANVSGGPGGLFFYDGAAWQSVCLLPSCRLGDEAITGISQLRAANNRFCAVFGTNTGFNRLDCWENGTWTGVLHRGDYTSDGTEITSFGNAYDVNRRGDVVAVVNTSLGGAGVFLKTADRFATVRSPVFPLPDESYLWAIYAVDLRDDRRVYILAQDWNGQMVIYEANPRF